MERLARGEGVILSQGQDFDCRTTGGEPCPTTLMLGLHCLDRLLIGLERLLDGFKH